MRGCVLQCMTGARCFFLHVDQTIGGLDMHVERRV